MRFFSADTVSHHLGQPLVYFSSALSQAVSDHLAERADSAGDAQGSGTSERERAVEEADAIPQPIRESQPARLCI